MLLEFCQWLRETEMSVGIRESLLTFPVIEGIHLIGVGVSAGLIAISDLRMAGVIFREQTVSSVFDKLLPYFGAGYLAVFITGILLFISEPMRCYESYWFWIKMVFLVAAGVNAGYYHLTIWKRRAEWDSMEIPPKMVQFAGWSSIVSWAIVIIAGRTMAYSF